MIDSIRYNNIEITRKYKIFPQVAVFNFEIYLANQPNITTEVLREKLAHELKKSGACNISIKENRIFFEGSNSLFAYNANQQIKSAIVLIINKLDRYIIKFTVEFEKPNLFLLLFIPIVTSLLISTAKINLSFTFIPVIWVLILTILEYISPFIFFKEYLEIFRKII